LRLSGADNLDVVGCGSFSRRYRRICDHGFGDRGLGGAPSAFFPGLRVSLNQTAANNHEGRYENFDVVANRHQRTPFLLPKIPRYPDAIKLQPDASISTISLQSGSKNPF
jgi:hypothetical protein